MDRLERLSQAAEDNPNDAGIWVELGEALLEVGAIDPAAHMAARARACEPATAQHWSALGALLLRLDDAAAALEALRAATILDAEDMQAATLYAQTAIEHGLSQEAEDLLKRATCFGDLPIRSYLLARAKDSQGATVEALEHALRAIRSDPPPVFEHVELAARLAHALERYDIEERSLLLLRQLNPRHVRHAISLADCLARRGRTDLAVQELDRVGRSSAITHEERAEAGARFLKLNDPARARVHLEHAAQALPESAAVKLLLGQALELSGDLESAIAAYGDAVDGEATGEAGAQARRRAQAQLGKALLKAGRPAEATPILVQAASENPTDADLQGCLKNALMMSGGADASPVRDGLSGDLSVFRIQELLEFLGIQRATGKLHLTSNGRDGVVQIVQGRLTEARYPGRVSLVTVLVARGHISTERARLLPRDVIDEDSRLAKVLLDAGAVSREQLESIAQARIEQGITHMLAWADGRARFEPEGDRAIDAFGFEHQRILMSVMTRIDEGRRP